MFSFVFHTTKSKAYIAPFESILIRLACTHKLQFAIQFEKKIPASKYSFIVCGVQQAILDFSDAISRELPLSLYFVFDTVLPIENPPKHFFAHPPKRSTKESMPSVVQINDFIATYTSSNMRLFSKIYTKLFLSHKNQNKKSNQSLPKKSLYTSPHKLPSLISNLINALKNHDSILLHTPRGSLCLNTQTKSEKVLFWDMQTIQTFTRVDSVQLSVLASFEKPSMKLCVKDVFRKELLKDNCVEIICMLAFDPMLMLLGSLAKQEGIEYVFVHKSKNYSQKSLEIGYSLTYALPKQQLLVCSKEGTLIENRKSKHTLQAIIKHHYPQELRESSSNENLLDSGQTTTSKRIKEHQLSYSKQMLTCYLSTKYPSALWTYDGTSFAKLLEVSFSTDVNAMLTRLEKYYKGADRLIANYKKHFGTETLNFISESSRVSTNIVDMFGIIAKVLGYCDKSAPLSQGVQTILSNAKLCLLDKGPRIDYKLIKNDQGVLSLDYPKILRSCMSFALAGVEKAILCYGILDSLGEFLGNFVRDMEQNYAIKQIFLCGDMLTHKIFFDKILLYLPRDITLILPQDGWIDSSL